MVPNHPRCEIIAAMIAPDGYAESAIVDFQEELESLIRRLGPSLGVWECRRRLAFAFGLRLPVIARRKLLAWYGQNSARAPLDDRQITIAFECWNRMSRRINLPLQLLASCCMFLAIANIDPKNLPAVIWAYEAIVYEAIVSWLIFTVAASSTYRIVHWCTEAVAQYKYKSWHDWQFSSQVTRCILYLIWFSSNIKVCHVSVHTILMSCRLCAWQ